MRRTMQAHQWTMFECTRVRRVRRVRRVAEYGPGQLAGRRRCTHTAHTADSRALYYNTHGDVRSPHMRTASASQKLTYMLRSFSKSAGSGDTCASCGSGGDIERSAMKYSISTLPCARALRYRVSVCAGCRTAIRERTRAAGPARATGPRRTQSHAITPRWAWPAMPRAAARRQRAHNAAHRGRDGRDRMRYLMYAYSER